jgi:uncharacterized protein YfaS (alpha-2-macroglobulin family)
MIRNILVAIVLFIGIAGLAYYQSRDPAKDVVVEPRIDQSVLLNSPMTLSPAGDFLPRKTLPTVTVQTELKSATLRYYHVQKAGLLLRLYRGIAQETLSAVGVARLLSEQETPVATMTMTPTAGSAKLDWHTPVQLGDAPGLYVVTVAKDLTGPAVAATWFFRTDMLLTAIEDRQDWRVLCQSLEKGNAIADVNLRWFGMGTQAMSVQSSCNAGGQARLAKSSLAANDVPQLVFGEDGKGNMAFVPLRAVRLPADDSAASHHFVFTDRHHYGAGQTVYAWTVGLQDQDKKLKLLLQRPDGLVVQEKSLAAGQGLLGLQNFILPDSAMTGQWSVVAVTEDGVRYETKVAVGTPEKRGQSRLKLLNRDGQKITVAASLLDADGVLLRDRAARIVLRWQAVRQLSALATDYVFGGYEQPELPAQTVASFITAGNNTLSFMVPAPPQLPYAVKAILQLELVDGGVSDAQSIDVAFPSQPWALGLKPLFSPDNLHGNSKAQFKVALFSTKEEGGDFPDVHYELVTERRSYRWFFADGLWDYKTDVATAPVLAGQVALDDKGHGAVAVPVQRGQYRLDVFLADRKIQSSWRFQVEAVNPEPVTHDLPLSVMRDNNENPIVPHADAPNGVSIVTADTGVQQILLASEKVQAASATIDDMPQGGTIIGMSPQVQTNGVWQMARGVAWLRPRSYAVAQKTQLKNVPDNLVAAQPVNMNVTLSAVDGVKPEGQQRFVQLVAVPEAAGMVSFLQQQDQARALQLALSSNVPAQWPEKSLEKQPSVSLTPLVSAMSAVIPVPVDGRVSVPLTFSTGGAYRLHLLVWNSQAVGETITAAHVNPAVVIKETVSALSSAPEVPWPTLVSSGAWSCQPVPAEGAGLTVGHSGLSSAFIVSPLPLPDMTALLGQLAAAETTRSDVLARSLLALSGYENIVKGHGITVAQLNAWKSRIARILLQRQQGDGGIALYADGLVSDLTASAFTLRAWQKFPIMEQSSVLERGLQDYLLRRLDVAWGADAELFPRSDAFYVLGERGQIDHAALRYFIEKYSNVIRHPVFEAELAAALQSIQDHEQSRIFAERAVAQLPSLRVDQPQTALQVIEILVQHDLVSAAMAQSQLPDIRRLPVVTSSLPAVTGAMVWSELARRLPSGQVMINGQNVESGGLGSHHIEAKVPTKLSAQPSLPLWACADQMGGVVPVAQPATTEKLQQQIYTTSGQLLKSSRLTLGSNYVVVVTVPAVTAGPAELVLDLPTGLGLRAIVPGGIIVGQYSWLKQVDPIVATRATPHGALLAMERSVAGDVRMAFVLNATHKGKFTMPAAQLVQFNTTYYGDPETITIE